MLIVTLRVPVAGFPYVDQNFTLFVPVYASMTPQVASVGVWPYAVRYSEKSVPAVSLVANVVMAPGGGFDSAAAVTVNPLGENTSGPSASVSRMPVLPTWNTSTSIDAGPCG